MRPFYLYQRPSGVWYAEFMNPHTGARLASKSTGSSNRDDAALIAAGWVRNGLPTPGKARKLESLLAVDAILRSVKEAPLNQADALRIVEALRSRGLVQVETRATTGPAVQLFAAWLEAFWSYDSPYIRERLAHGQRATHRHCADMAGRGRGMAALLPDASARAGGPHQRCV